MSRSFVLSRNEKVKRKRLQIYMLRFWIGDSFYLDLSYLSMLLSFPCESSSKDLLKTRDFINTVILISINDS